MIYLTNSIFKGFLECPAKAMAMYRGRILGDQTIAPEWEEPTTEAMAAGSLVDAMVTRGFTADENDKSVKPADFYTCLKSSYDDGMKNASVLCNKSGGWNMAARKAIAASHRLLADPIVQSLLDGAILQPRISFLLADGVAWQGDIDILTVHDGQLHIIDLKSPSRTEDGWITVQGRNVRVPWYDAWSYWFQLAGYLYGIENGAILNGASWNQTALGIPADTPANTGILFASREDVPEIGYVPIGGHTTLWETIIKGQPKSGGASKLEAIKAIATGQAEAPRCGKCAYCKSKSAVVIPESDSAWDYPEVDDIFGLQDII